MKFIPKAIFIKGKVREGTWGRDITNVENGWMDGWMDDDLDDDLDNWSLGMLTSRGCLNRAGVLQWKQTLLKSPQQTPTNGSDRRRKELQNHWP
jgi:hypothetical protein